jgi:hypothetical protein
MVFMPHWSSANLVGTKNALTMVKEKNHQPEKEQIMNTKLNVRVAGNDTVVGHNHLTLHGNGFGITRVNAVNDETIHEAPKTERTLVKTIAMFLTAPFIGLAYVIALPIIGIYHLAKLALEAYAKKVPATTTGKLKKAMVSVKNIGLFFISPLVALGYVVALPFVGFFMISRLAIEAHRNSACTNS